MSIFSSPSAALRAFLLLVGMGRRLPEPSVADDVGRSETNDENVKLSCKIRSSAWQEKEKFNQYQFHCARARAEKGGNRPHLDRPHETTFAPDFEREVDSNVTEEREKGLDGSLSLAVASRRFRVEVAYAAELEPEQGSRDGDDGDDGCQMGFRGRVLVTW